MRRFWTICGGTAVVFSCAAVGVVHAQSPATGAPTASQVWTTPTLVPRLMQFDGQLPPPTGQPRTGAVLLSFGLYADQTGGPPLWTESHAVRPDAEGRYSVILGSLTAGGIPADLFVANAPQWLGVDVESAPAQPRMNLRSVPYSLKAADADTLGGRPLTEFIVRDNLKTALNDVVVGSSGAINPPGVLGTQNSVSKFAPDGTSQVDSEIFATGSLVAPAVGIGTNSPLGPLHLKSNSVAGTSFFYENTDTGGRRWRLLSTGTANTGGAGTLGIVNATDDPNNYKLVIAPSGNVGIGTSVPLGALHLASAAAAGTSFFYQNAGPGGRTWRLLSTGSANTGGAGILGIVNATDDPNNYKMVITPGGFVGIGTTAPTAMLHVQGDVAVIGNATVNGNIGAKYQDVAEWVETTSPLDAGTVVIVDPSQPNRVLPAPKAYDTRVAGAVSRQPGLILGEGSDTKAMVAQSGRVRVKADASYGAIKIGDLLVTSPTPGYAMRSRPMRVGTQSLHRPGTLLGKALEALPDGQGEILVLLTLQ